MNCKKTVDGVAATAGHGAGGAGEKSTAHATHAAATYQRRASSTANGSGVGDHAASMQLRGGGQSLEGSAGPSRRVSLLDLTQLTSTHQPAAHAFSTTHTSTPSQPDTAATRDADED